MNKTVEKRILALHYVYPKPLNKLKFLLAADPELSAFSQWPGEKLAACLGVKETEAIRIQQTYRQALIRPLMASYEKHHITPIFYWHSSYPASLKILIDPPVILYAKGRTEWLATPRKIAVVGSRKATNYSVKSMDSILPPLISRDFAIVSGLAKGADTAAHQKAIDLGGRTIAVTGSGFMHPYPKENTGLFNIIEENHLLVSEYPPYMKPERWNFPMRNRIISGLSDGVVVTEAEKRSGTMSTIEHALDHGKEIFAVPGSIFSPLSEGPHKLISEGAKPVWNGWQILEEFGETAVKKEREGEKPCIN